VQQHEAVGSNEPPVALLRGVLSMAMLSFFSLSCLVGYGWVLLVVFMVDFPFGRFVEIQIVILS
jgi:hypothetical protein